MGQDKSQEAVDPEDTGIPCDQNKKEHRFKNKIFKCDTQNCEEIICKGCIGSTGDVGQRFCSLCTLNNQAQGDDMVFDAKDGGQISGVEHIFNVGKNKTTGAIEGWDNFYRFIDVSGETQALVEEFQDQRQKVEASFTITSWEDTSFQLKETATGKIHEVHVIIQEENKGKLLGLPSQLNQYLFNFTEKDIYEDTRDVLDCLITMCDAKGNAQGNLIQRLPRDSVAILEAQDHSHMLTTDPSKVYDIVDKLGQGGFAKVFKVRRRSDSYLCALKFIEPKNEQEKELIINEIGVMRKCGANQGILKVIEAYDFKQKLWVFLELMDDALTKYVQTLHKTYSENIVKFVLKKTLEGLQFLHNRHIIHRDIKSDNLLFNTKGEVKLADFGYAVQLTEQKAGRKSKVGTVCWMAPELIRGERQYGTKVDIWSFGIFAMEMADGDPPYISEPQGRVIFNIVKKDPPPINARWSKEFQNFISLCLTKDPEKRPSASDLLKHPFLTGVDKYQTEFAESVQGFITLKASIIH